MKKTWSILKTAMNKTAVSYSLPDYFIINDGNVSDKKDIVDKFNKYFATIGSDISNTVPQTQTPYT